MKGDVTIFNTDYINLVADLTARYRQAQVRAALRVNKELILFYLYLGKCISDKQVDNRYGAKFYESLSRDLKREMPGVEGLSETNIRYAYRIYSIYNQVVEILPQVVAEFDTENLPQPVADLCSIPWGHHRYIADKCIESPQKAYFYVKQTIANNWSRAVLLNFLDTDLYERQGKALTNFSQTLSMPSGDLAQEMTKDPYSFAFTGIRGKYNEKKLKDALLSNISNFLVELGTGFSYIGKEYRLQIGNTENFIDLLFYNTQLRCYVVIEVKVDKFDARDIGQLGTYVTAANHILKDPAHDNPTIGLLICKSKDNVLAQYALESSSQPIGISEYELSRLYPEKVEGTIPSIEELEANIKNNLLK